ncbi:MAG: ATP-binding protein [Planctomycetes bacterium]|nr:ATP-binding protein [Planctomycetota bacterium]
MQTLTRQFTITCNTSNLQEMRQNLQELFDERKISVRESSLIVHAADEALSAIMLHANETGSHGDIHITIDINDVRCSITIDDNTGVYELNGNGGATLNELLTSVSKLKKYQISLLMMQEILDEIYYNFKKGFQNELILIKFLSTKKD